ncbi:hypothetical protein A45J_2584 [hot springs metagenome]|uniref:Uncharacterized protein n=1 Tax=hot springs metagenome TaxID=433727 RepID=A0A5J4L9T0_9ZZZZ
MNKRRWFLYVIVFLFSGIIPAEVFRFLLLKILKRRRRFLI